MTPAFTCEFFSVTPEEFARYEEAYPGVSVLVEFAKMERWLWANPERGPKKKYRKFVNGWLARVHGRLLEAQTAAATRECIKTEKQHRDAMVGQWEGYRK